jgi:GNAT superfamily N-acetyltransferase
VAAGRDGAAAGDDDVTVGGAGVAAGGAGVAAGGDGVAAGGDGAAAGGDGAAAGGEGIVAIVDEAALLAAMAAVDALEFDAREAAVLASLGFGGPMWHFAVMRDGEPVGLASTFAWRSTLTLTQLAVAPAWRRRGLGRALVRHALPAGSLALLSPTPATIPFYDALGFRLVRFPPDRTFYIGCRE